jgi:hypothetical protein
MNCVELEASLAEVEDGRSPEQRDHLKNCPECSTLVTELILIASTAVELRANDEPGPHVWKSIESALRQEGIIRPQRASRSLLPSISSRWAWARWMVPAAAALLITVGLYVRQHSLVHQLASVTAPLPSAPSDQEIGGLNDDDLLQEVAEQSPAVKAQYADNLRRVNEYIRDAKAVVVANPNDDEARRSLMEAYQQKAMLFELAMDRSLP